MTTAKGNTEGHAHAQVGVTYAVMGCAMIEKCDRGTSRTRMRRCIPVMNYTAHIADSADVATITPARSVQRVGTPRAS